MTCNSMGFRCERKFTVRVDRQQRRSRGGGCEKRFNYMRMRLINLVIEMIILVYQCIKYLLLIQLSFWALSSVSSVGIACVTFGKFISWWFGFLMWKIKLTIHTAYCLTEKVWKINGLILEKSSNIFRQKYYYQS